MPVNRGCCWNIGAVELEEAPPAIAVANVDGVPDGMEDCWAPPESEGIDWGMTTVAVVVTGMAVAVAMVASCGVGNTWKVITLCMAWCLVNSLWALNPWGHWLHLNGRSPVCMNMW